MSTPDYLTLAMPGIAELKPYQPGKPLAELERELGISGAVKLASNENPLGPSSQALVAAQQALATLSLYPDANGYQLKQALAAKHGVSTAQITLGNGSNDVLDLIARTFLGPGRAAVFSAHAFIVYPLITRAASALAQVAPAHDGSRGSRFGHDPVALLAALTPATRLMLIANPNNPTGTYLRKPELHALLTQVPPTVVVVLDEAYVEYVTAADYPDASHWLAEFPNLIVTRTFSKAYGLAGLRLGYALSSLELADLLNRVRQPFNVNSIALAAATAALGDAAHVAATVALNQTERANLAAALTTLGLAVIPSVANFLCVDLGRPARPVFEALLRHGLITRPVAEYDLPQHLRISIGLPEQNQRLIAALTEVLA